MQNNSQKREQNRKDVERKINQNRLKMESVEGETVKKNNNLRQCMNLKKRKCEKKEEKMRRGRFYAKQVTKKNASMQNDEKSLIKILKKLSRYIINRTKYLCFLVKSTIFIFFFFKKGKKLSTIFQVFRLLMAG